MPQLILLEPWIQSAASYGLLVDKHHAGQAKSDQMVFLRDLGIVVEDERIGGDNTESVPGKHSLL